MKKKLNRKKIEEVDLYAFIVSLHNWSQWERSFFFVDFYRSFGMTEMQFYKRLSLAEEKIKLFPIESIKRNLKVNRFLAKKNKDALLGKVTNFKEE